MIINGSVDNGGWHIPAFSPVSEGKMGGMSRYKIYMTAVTFLSVIHVI